MYGLATSRERGGVSADCGDDSESQHINLADHVLSLLKKVVFYAMFLTIDSVLPFPSDQSRYN